MASEVPVIRLVNQMPRARPSKPGSDVHIEPFRKSLKVRYRIDGILHEVESPPRPIDEGRGDLAFENPRAASTSRAAPAPDGRIKTRLGGKDIDCESPRCRPSTAKAS